ncbi:MAG: hypothetical protein PHR53_04440 [Bacteroidales bacterium]|nr:hypothetical protein [Bacteroidales bacterium]
MKTFLLLFTLMTTPISLIQTPKTGFDKERCVFIKQQSSSGLKETPLYGKVKVVEYFADFKVQIVSSFPDLRVKSCHFASSCGEWEFVESFPDFTVQFVEYFPDFTIQFED